MTWRFCNNTSIFANGHELGPSLNASLGFGLSKPVYSDTRDILISGHLEAMEKLKSRRLSAKRIPSQFLANSLAKVMKEVKLDAWRGE